MIYFGLKLKQLRQNKSLTQQKLADRLDLTKATISAYESSAKHPSVEALMRICIFFNVSADYLLDLSDSKDFNIAPLTDEQIRIVNALIEQFSFLNNLTQTDVSSD